MSEIEKKELEACKRWLKEFSMIPVALLEKAYPNGEGIKILAPSLEDYKREYYEN